MNDFRALLINIITMNKDHRAKHYDALMLMEPYDCMVEYQTIRCDIGRQTGKSRTIRELCEILVDSYVITVKEDNAKTFKNGMTCKSFLQMEHVPQIGHLFIEEPTFSVPDGQLEQVYRKVLQNQKNMETTIIIVGI